jgi:hypothetical protein
MAKELTNKELFKNICSKNTLQNKVGK